ncbi:MAG: DUF1549 domain-containing protein, partial [Bryobacteraceae bacterium]
MARTAAAIICALTACCTAFAEQPADFFETRIRPVLAKNCFTCHTASAMGGLQLDSRANLMKGGQDGVVVIPGDPDKSLLIQAVRQTHEWLKMPPKGKLSEREIDDFSSWVKSGAVWPEGAAPSVVPAGPAYVITQQQRDFWAFKPVHKPAIPAVRNQSWPRNSIDKFILAQLEEKGLQPVKPAEKRVLLRRATFDLTGLPPTPTEIDQFLSDTSPGAFAKVVDRLLASPHYGERWGRYWLDLARYADGQLGASKDTPYPNGYRYRDWVVSAFNSDMPYDLFVKAQIAGDQMKSDQPEKLLPGLAFYAMAADGDDRVDVTGQVFLGLTIGCAKCHDHKYDPIPTKDFYSLLGVFKSTEVKEYPLAADAVVESYKAQKKKIDDQKIVIEDFVQKHSTELTEILAAKTSRYMVAAWQVLTTPGASAPDVAEEEKLDATILLRWVAYLKTPNRDHKFLAPWDELLASKGKREQAQKVSDEFQTFVLSVF